MLRADNPLMFCINLMNMCMCQVLLKVTILIPTLGYLYTVYMVITQVCGLALSRKLCSQQFVMRHLMPAILVHSYVSLA